jgi:predicted transglutaminase-like cysteine proteinase
MDKSLRLLAPAAAALATAFPSMANAQTMAPAALSSVSLSKSEAILGGTRSALAEIMAQQQGIALPAIAPVQPAARMDPLRMNAVLRTDVKLAVAPAVQSGRPDVFGSIALSVGRTPLDARWHRAERARVGGSYATWARSLRGFDAVERADFVNRFVNNRVTFVDDSRQYGRADVWTSASETLRRRRGDCEDFAIAKMQLLREAGSSDRDLYLVIVKDLVRRADHAVLVMRAGRRMLLLDNGTDELLDSESVADYRPVLTFASGGAWTHGYRRSTPAITIASADVPAGDQRSRSASLLAFNTGFSR